MTERDDSDIETHLLEGANLLGDEGFGEPGVAFKDERDRASHHGHEITPGG